MVALERTLICMDSLVSEPCTVVTKCFAALSAFVGTFSYYDYYDDSTAWRCRNTNMREFWKRRKKIIGKKTRTKELSPIFKSGSRSESCILDSCE